MVGKYLLVLLILFLLPCVIGCEMQVREQSEEITDEEIENEIISEALKDFEQDGLITDQSPADLRLRKRTWLSCEDSDDLDYFQRGKVRAVLKRGISKVKLAFKDKCRGDGELVEFYCEGKEPKAEIVGCESGCMGGKCATIEDICPQPLDGEVGDLCYPLRSCANVAYWKYNDDSPEYDPEGDRNVFDLWLTDSESPTPIVIFVHGGGFHHGAKEDIYDHCYSRQESSLIKVFLDSGVSVASINYRLINEERIKWAYTHEWYEEASHYPTPMIDAGRALAFIREHATDYNIDQDKVAVIGTSAGGGIAFWLGFHEEILDIPTRPNCIGPWKGQSTYDPRIVYELVPGAYKDRYMLGFYNIDRGDFDLSVADDYDVLFNEASPITHITEDGPPVFMYYTQPHLDEDGYVRGMHNPIFGLYAETFFQDLGIPYELHFPGHDGLSEYNAARNMRDFFFEHCF